MPSAREPHRRAQQVIAEAKKFLAALDQSRTPSGRRAQSAHGRQLIDQSRAMIERTHALVRDSRRRGARSALWVMGTAENERPDGPTPDESRSPDYLPDLRKDAAIVRPNACNDRVAAAEARRKAECARRLAAERRELSALHRASRLNEPSGQRGRAADQRDQAADERDRIADERDRIADERDQAANERE